MTLEALKKSGSIIFECIAGSKAYGLDTATSDTDIRGVFILPKSEYFSLNYTSQVNDKTNDIVYYELNKFIELCTKNNPNILELLNIPEDKILFQHPLFGKIKMEYFLSKRCEFSFGSYAYAQIKKARGLHKKISNPVEKIRKSILNFCYVYVDGKSKRLIQFLNEEMIDQKDCGLASVPNITDCYNLFYSATLPYSGVMSSMKANDINLSSIPKGEKQLALLYFNKNGYSAYCKKYAEYWDWVDKRNDVRYKNTVAHGKNYDSKNIMHTFRLLNMAKEIAVEKTVNVHRKDRTFLLDIRNGKFEYDQLVEWADELKAQLPDLFANSGLRDRPDREMINDLVVEIRTEFYVQN